MIPLSIAPDLMEEAVLLAERQAERDVARAFRRERDRIYEVTEPELREARFRSLHQRWFVGFGLQARVEATVNEYAEFAGRLTGGRIVRAIARSEEGADLLDPVREHASPGPLLVLRLRPASLVEPDTLQTLLRHELMHVADMLDPTFEYERKLPPADDGPSADNMLRDRYRVVWDVTIDGRLARAGRGSAGTRDARCREFRDAFPVLGDGCRSAFARWWNEPCPTHADLVAFARRPAGTDEGLAASRCPVCRFPVASLDGRVSTLGGPVLTAIRAEHPVWRVEQGLCLQCFDLYEARHGHNCDGKTSR